MKSKKSIKSIVMITILAIPIMFFITIKSLAAEEIATVNVETANLREMADQNSKILEQIPTGEEVEIIEKSGEWYKVKVHNVTGYLRQDLLNVKEQEESQNNNIQAENKQLIELGTYKIVENTKLKIIPAINATDIIEIKKEEKIEITEIINGWLCIETDTAKGWAREEKIQIEEDKKEEQVQETLQEEVVVEEVVQEEQPQKQEEISVEENKTTTKTLYVNASTVNVRKEPSTSSEVVTNASMNTAVEVLSENGGWCKVRINGVEGYIASSLLSETKQQTSRSMETSRKESQETTNTNTSETQTQNTNSGNTTNSSTGSSVVATAKNYIGSKYVYGGTSPSGFDCSGFTQYVYKQYGISLNRTAGAQYSNGTAVTRAQLQPGDLIMFRTSASGINHVGIYIGGGQIVHAANPSRGVTTDTINSGYYNTNYVGARRVL